MTVNLNVAPYYDDFDPSKNYHKILFVPGRPIQARELTQIQSILQHQIKLNGDYIFKNGAMVIPGGVSYLNKVQYIKLESLFNGVVTDDIIANISGKKIVGESTNVKATVVHVEPSTNTDTPTIYIAYTSGGIVGSTSYKEFTINEVLHLETDTDIKFQIKNHSTYTGFGTLASIREGVYYINGFFVQNLAQTISLDKYGTTPSYKVGLDVVENIVTATDDASIRDNAVDSPSYGAAGADRLQIILTMNKTPLFATEENVNNTTDSFIDLLHVKDGYEQFKIDKTELGEFEKTLARRTFDESGDYVVEPFDIKIHEYRNNFRGEWTVNTVYLEGDIVTTNTSDNDYAPTDTSYFVAENSGVSGTAGIIFNSTSVEQYNDGGYIVWNYERKPKFNDGLFQPQLTESLDTQIENSLKAAYKIAGGKAYIKGYEISNPGYKIVDFNKARAYKNVPNSNVNTTMGQYFLIHNLQGLSYSQYQQLDLFDSLGVQIGTCIYKNLDFHRLGVGGPETNQYKLFVFDIQMIEGNYIEQIKTIAGSGFTCYVYGERKKGTGSVSFDGTDIFTGTGTLFTTELNAGDIIYVDDSRFVVASVSSSIELIVDDTQLPDTLPTGYYPFYTDKTAVYGTPGYIKKLNHNSVRSVRGSDDITVETTYYVNRLFIENSNTNVITITLTNPNESFASDQLEGNFLATQGSNFPVLGVSDGIFTVSGPTLNILTVTGFDNFSGIYIQTTIKKVNSAAKEKQYLKDSDIKYVNTLSQANADEIPLNGVALKLSGVYQAADFIFDFSLPDAIVDPGHIGYYTIDVTKNYVIGSNDTQNYTTASYLKPVNGFIPSGPILIVYEILQPQTNGDYFSINSYNDVPYADMPTYNGTSIGDYIDFRPVKEYDPNPLFVSQSEAISSRYPFTLDYSAYLPRYDIVQLDPSGNFRIEEGIPSDKPVAPIQNDNNVIISYAKLSPYTIKADTNNIILKMNDLRRYTMRDIGKIDNRLKNAEYYVALTSLERETSELQIKDENGLDRYKNGFIIDQFKDHGIGNISNVDYKCAVSPKELECRPTYYADSIKLFENLATSRASKRYQITGDLVTLPYTEVPVIEQKIATSAEYITAYAKIRSMTGDLKLYPAGDTWVDTETLPEVTQQSEGNFNALQILAQSTGILGVVYGGWKVDSRTNISSNVSVGQSSSTVNNAFGGSATTVVTTTTLNGTDSVDLSREGVDTQIAERYDEVGRVTGIVDQSWSPAMREKAIVLYCKKMMPLTPFDAYIDNMLLTKYIVPASTIYYTSKVGNFLDYSTSDIDHTDLVSRQYGVNEYDILERGEVIVGQTSNATAITICEERQNTNGVVEDVLRVVNIKGTFVLGETITGQSSGATLKYDGVNTDLVIRTTSSGSFYGIFMLPNNDEHLIYSGIVTVSLRNNPEMKESSTSAEAAYDGHGLVQQKQTTVMSVRNAVLIQTDIHEEKTEIQNWSRPISSTSSTSLSGPQSAPPPPQNCRAQNCGGGGGGGFGGGGRSLNCNCSGLTDPLAQTFMHNDRGGIFITSMDIFVHTLDTESSAGIILQIQEVVNGYPGQTVVPFSTVTKLNHEINASSTTLVPTNFKFESPVFLKENTDYCYILSTDQSNTKVWVAKMGEVGLDGQVVVKQPNMGSFFRSQNALTWTSDQMVDVSFVLYKAKFDINGTGTFSMKSSITDKLLVASNPFKFTDGEKLVRVYHRNHGMVNGSSVTYSGVDITGSSYPTKAVMNSSFIISNAELDTYTITLPSAAEKSGLFGGGSVKSTVCKRFDTAYLNGSDFVLPSTHIDYSIRTSIEGTNRVYRSPTSSIIQIKQDLHYDVPQFALSPENERLFLNGDASLNVEAFLYSNNENVSPVIDFPTFALFAISNKINNPTEDLNLEIDSQGIINLAQPDVGGVVEVTLHSIIISGAFVPSLVNRLDMFRVGKYISIQSEEAAPVPPRKIVKLDKQYSSNYFEVFVDPLDTLQFNANTGLVDPVTIFQYNHYTDVISPNATSNLANYVTRIVTLSKPSTGIRILFDYNKPSESFIDIYYKVCMSADYTDLEKVNWINLEENSSPKVEYKDSQNYNTFIEHEINISDISEITDAYSEYDQIMVKVVMRSNNTARCPRIKNFRLIALA